MSRSCVCGGTNENCRYCGGTGMIPDRLGAALDATLQRLQLENSPTEDIKFSPKRKSSQISIKPRPTIEWVQCPKGCGRWVNPRKLKRHLNRVHTTNPASSQMANASLTSPKPSKAERKYETCPVCWAKVRVERINGHVARVHTNRPVATATSQPHRITAEATKSVRMSPVSRKVESEYETCPLCKVRVRASRINRHMRKAHKRTPTNPHRAVPLSSKDPLRDTTTLVAPRDKNLDATKLYAHPYREQGRYGSHPSHDGFDDESGPE